LVKRVTIYNYTYSCVVGAGLNPYLLEEWFFSILFLFFKSHNQHLTHFPLSCRAGIWRTALIMITMKNRKVRIPGLNRLREKNPPNSFRKRRRKSLMNWCYFTNNRIIRPHQCNFLNNLSKRLKVSQVFNRCITQAWYKFQIILTFFGPIIENR